MRGAGVPILVLVAAASTSAGCSFDRPPKPDAPDEIIDPPFPTDPLEEDEGGEIRVEHVRFAGGNAAARVTAYLYERAGLTRAFPPPDLDGCTDVSEKTHWPTAENPLSERLYLDPGEVVIVGGPAPLTVPRRDMQGKDVMGRTHAAGQWFSHFAGETGTDGGTYLAANTHMDVAFTGTSSVPAQFLVAKLYMPHDFELVEPGTAPVALEAGMPLTFTWTTPRAPTPSNVEVLSMVTFVDGDTQAVLVLCIEPNNGSIWVPAEMIDLVRAKAPQGGTLRRQTLTHNIQALVDRRGPTSRRLDLIAAWGYETEFTVPEPPRGGELGAAP